ncbi:hypothetical protein P691DRAFT_809192 [Macrolepiota fuliginosa MF-IS2]|uniref:Uncharacterized protein n=1 Tax=Macrolepiota fuliginosa MF-IS2 TaxID=1400762 RepID=A0A9P5X4X6_9AGAR|nr:hypothetical protein P691DRAFT_809192 [Macrolepiota fuliginosa MF-IS2]
MLGRDNPSQAGQPFLPALRTLEITGAPHYHFSRIDELPPYLIEMLWDRHRRSDLGLCIKLGFRLDWSDDDIEYLRGLVRSGYEFELWQEGRRIE